MASESISGRAGLHHPENGRPGDHHYCPRPTSEGVRPKHLLREVVALAYNPVRTEPFIVYTASYSRGPKANPEGDLFRGQTVKIKEGTVFCVTETDKS